MNDESWAMDNLTVSVTTVNAQAVPEPATMTMLGAALLTAAGSRYRRKRNRA